MQRSSILLTILCTWSFPLAPHWSPHLIYICFIPCHICASASILLISSLPHRKLCEWILLLIYLSLYTITIVHFPHNNHRECFHLKPARVTLRASHLIPVSDQWANTLQSIFDKKLAQLNSKPEMSAFKKSQRMRRGHTYNKQVYVQKTLRRPCVCLRIWAESTHRNTCLLSRLLLDCNRISMPLEKSSDIRNTLRMSLVTS